jgi:hypothetical protein
MRIWPLAHPHSTANTAPSFGPLIMHVFPLREWTTYVRHLICLFKNLKTPWFASELYRPSDRHLSAKWLPTFADRVCHVVSVTVPYGRIVYFIDRSRYFSIKYLLSCTHEAEWGTDNSKYTVGGTNQSKCTVRVTDHSMCPVRATDHSIRIVRATSHSMCIFRLTDHSICIVRVTDYSTFS